jgi:8-oxo-dGTP pyrophosphatase MutT (NUDIX family)
MTLADRPESWPVSEVEDVWSGPAPFSVRRDMVSAPAAPDVTFGRLVLQHPGAVVVLAIDDQERVLVLHQYRHPVQQRLVELPAGLLDVEGEDPVLAARRELQEEALVVAQRWTHLLTTCSSPGLSSEVIHYYVAQDLSAAADRGGFEPEHEELDMTVEWVALGDLVEAVRSGRVSDGTTVTAVLGYLQFLR